MTLASVMLYVVDLGFQRRLDDAAFGRQYNAASAAAFSPAPAASSADIPAFGWVDAVEAVLHVLKLGFLVSIRITLWRPLLVWDVTRQPHRL